MLNMYVEYFTGDTACWDARKRKKDTWKTEKNAAKF